MIYLLRHGEIKGAGTKRFIGQTDVGLSQKGMDQAGCWQNYFADITLDRVFASPLSRTVQTAEIVSGLARNKILLMDELKEIALGSWDGKTFAEVKENFPGEWAKRGNDLSGYTPPGGESFSDLSNRVLPLFYKITAQISGNILMVAHAGVNRVILCTLLKKDLKDLFTIPQDYGCLNIISNDGKEVCQMGAGSDYCQKIMGS